MYISGAKFEEYCSNIPGDILDSVFKVAQNSFQHLDFDGSL